MKKFLQALIVLAGLTVSTLGLFITVASAQQNFTIPSDSRGKWPIVIRPAPTYVQARVLAATVSETFSFPATTRVVIFSANCDFYAKTGATAAIPAADVTDGTASELNPSAWYFANAAATVQTVSVISASACIVTASAYVVPLQ